MKKSITASIMIMAWCVLPSINTTAQDTAKIKNPELSFFGNGNIQKSLDAGEKIPANTGLGVSFEQWRDTTRPLWGIIDKIQLVASINVASNVDTLSAQYDTLLQVTNASEFGSSVLTPLNSGQAVHIALRLNLKKGVPWEIIDGIKASYVGSNRNWMVNNGTSTYAAKATCNSFRIGVFHEFLPKNLLDEYSINLALNFAYNSIKGDVGLSKNNAVRENVLGTAHKHFMGPEFCLEVKLRNLKAQFAYSWLQANKEVAGLTGGRLVTTIAFVGGFGLKLK